MLKTLFRLTQLITFFCFSITFVYPQVSANFIADDTIGCNPLTVNFTNTGSTGPDFTYQWKFGNIGTSGDENPTFTFANPSDIQEIFPVTLVVTNINTSENDSVIKNITVIRTPSAELIIDSTNACVNGDVVFHTGYDSKDSVVWNFGDGNIGHESILQDVYHSYSANGSYNLQFITYSKGCSDTSDYTINIGGPVAGFNVSSKYSCVDSPILYTLSDTSGVSAFSWDFGNNNLFYTDSVLYSYDKGSTYIAKLNVSGPSGNCMIDDTVTIIEVSAGFTFEENRFCDQQYVNIQDTSTGSVTHRQWDFGNGMTGSGSNSAQLYSPGNYVIKLKVSNDLGCTDSTQNEITVNNLPSLQLSDDTTICLGRSITVNAVSNGQKITWTPGAGLNNTSIFNPVATPDSTTRYYITVTDTLTKCRQFGQLTISIQDENAPHDEPTLLLSKDTTICSGKTIEIGAFTDAHKIEWQPVTGLNNPNVFAPLATPVNTITYKATVTDTITKCKQSSQLTISVQQPDSINKISVLPLDTTIYKGEFVTINASVDSLHNFLIYTWSPDDGQINCTLCTNPVVQPLESQIYKLEVTDPNFCYFPREYNVVINVKDEYIIFVPKAFTPNLGGSKDGINDEIKVDGVGIKKLVEFRIYNRWGTEVFFTDDLNQGWDGYYKGNLQSMDSYAYIVKAELFDDQIVVKKGTFTLIR